MRNILFTIGITAVCLLALIVLAMPSVVGGFQPSAQSRAVYNTPKGPVSVQWGYSGSKVEYVAFSFDGTDNPPAIVTTQSSAVGPVDLVIPDREPRAFPLEANVFEWSHGEFTEKRMALDREAVDEYCDHLREEFSIADFEAFLASR